ncbi:hypothetical protein [Levilactobacillus bambusae]|uniref:Uncharacterized protein n=1 Tax=Levilactobacillus bambusae TaxID=2024736 RepID=A0A2V1N3T4_9LACO|nr:hypothetical protein [Levilactobacillus bambusae]PWG00725.1 hypothetical protein DCM90_00690 [Levilactobacillus bambusae]
MADQNNDENVEIQPGSDEFAKMVFRLNGPITDENQSLFNYNGGQLQEIQEGVYAEPAFVNGDLNMFFVIAQLIGEDWIISFSQATIEDENQITDLSDPIPTGQGLNMVGSISGDDANQILQYFQTLIDTNHGEWRMLA